MVDILIIWSFQTERIKLEQLLLAINTRWLRGFPAQKHERWRFIISPSKESHCQVVLQNKFSDGGGWYTLQCSVLQSWQTTPHVTSDRKTLWNSIWTSRLRRICRNPIGNHISNHFQMWLGSDFNLDMPKNGFGLVVWTRPKRWQEEVLKITGRQGSCICMHVEQINSQTNKTVGAGIYLLWLLDVSSENNKRFLPLWPWLMHSLALHKLPPTAVFH